MRVTLVLYARLADLAGRREWTSELAPGSTVADAWTQAVDTHPGLNALSGRVSAAVNAEFAAFGRPLSEGDEVAFLPPVSGGSGGRR